MKATFRSTLLLQTRVIPRKAARMSAPAMVLVLLICLAALAAVAYADTTTFTAEELLGKPTDASVTINVVPASTIQYRYQYRMASGSYTEAQQTAPVTATGGQPSEVTIEGLSANTQYYYRMVYDGDGSVTDGDYETRAEHTFHTQRAAGQSFVFTVTSDIHNSLSTGYRNVMTNVLGEQSDFHIDLGDTFMTDGAGGESGARTRYESHRGSSYMGKIGSSIPIFLTPGNHEDEEGWNLDDTGTYATGLWNINMRKSYFPTPTSDGFYSGNTDPLPSAIGGDTAREDYYAWTWGDALFIVIDEFQYTMNLPYTTPAAGEMSDDSMTGDQWSWTLGQQQYTWLRSTLENSDAKYKFVFSHNMLGGIPNLNVSGVGPGYVRGGAQAAAYFEWGGKNADGSEGFATHRPGWGKPIHQLFVENGVSAYFHGHDHQFVYETRDGVVYQEVPSGGGMSGFGGIYSEGDHGTYQTIEQQLSGNGHLRIAVGADDATVDFISSSSTAGTVNYTYSIDPGAPSTDPSITTTGALTAFSSLPGTPSTPQDYQVSGSNLTAGIAIAAPADFEISLTSGSGWTSSLTLPQSGGSVASTPVYVRLNRASEGTSSGNIVHSSAGATNRSQAVTGTAADPSATPITFTGKELLGRPTDTSMSVKVVPDEAISLYYEYGTTSGVYTNQTATETATAGQPKTMVISGLAPNTHYYYRMKYHKSGETLWVTRDAHSFWTRRAAGSTFTFDVTTDGHVGIQLGNASNWQSTLNGVAFDAPDFLIELGDTVAMDAGSGGSIPVGDTAAAEDVYKDTLPYFNTLSASSPIFLLPGNHEQQEIWHGTAAGSLPIMGKNAEKKFFLNPVPNAFYSGNSRTLPNLSGDQLVQDYYSFTWGDALFVTICPFWTTTTKPYTTSVGGGEDDTTGSGDRWDWTLGLDQFNWLKSTLQDSDAKYKFVFSHQIVGGNAMSNQVNYGHGGIDSANFVEWGGYNTNGTTWAWNTERPGWGDQPIRQMMEANGVTAFFHGHDHQMAYETANGMVYQAVPSASFSGSFGNYTTGNTYTVRDGAGGTSTGQTVWADSNQGPGRLRVTVGPEEAEVDFVRYNQTSSAAYSYTMEPAGGISLATATIAAIANQTYTGAAITPTVTVTLGATTLVKDTDYTVLYANNLNVGTATVTVTGIGSYTGSKQASFAIVRATPTVSSWPTASAIALGQALSASTLSGGAASVAGSFAFTTPSTVPAVAGTYTASVTFTPTDTANHNSVTDTVPVQVGAIDIATATIAAIPDQTYTAAAITPTVTVTLGASTLGEGTDYTVAYASNVNVGTATVTVTGIGNYTGSKQASFAIVRATPTVSSWPTASAITLGQALSASTLSGGAASVDGSFAFTTPTTVPTVGPYTASVTFTPTDATSYNPVDGSVLVQVNALKKVIDIAEATIAAIAKQTYTGAAITPEVTVTLGASTLVKDTDYTLAYSSNIRSGKAQITVSGKGDYSGSKAASFVIVPKKSSISKLKAGSKKLTATWKKHSGASGYELAYSTKKSSGFKKLSTTSAAKTVKGLKSNKRYYVKLRAYTTIDGTRSYGAWSSIKSVKVK